MGPRRDTYLAALPAALREQWRRRGTLGGELDHALIACAENWPLAPLDEEAFIGYLAARATPEPPADGAPFPHARDLYMACAIVSGFSSALALFEQRYMPLIVTAVASFKLGSHDLDEVKQRLRQHLLVSESGGPPRLADYSGCGALAAWLHISAVRIAIKMKRSRTPVFSEDDELEQVASTSASPEGQAVTAEGREAFAEAFAEAIRSLEPQEQNVVRQHYLDGLTLNQLGALYQVHRTTVAYWLERARNRLIKRTRAALMQRSKLSAAEAESLLGHARSQFAITMRSMFGG